MEQKLKRGFRRCSSPQTCRSDYDVEINDCSCGGYTVDSTNIGLGLVNYWFNYWSRYISKIKSSILVYFDMLPSSLVLLVVGSVASADPVRKPHIMLVLADDFGWYNIGWRNPEIRSPALDGLAKDGIILNRHYTFKYCSPTRSSLLSGRLPLHVNQNNECNLIESRSGIDLRMTLLPAKMKQAGYSTHMVGKGHLGARTPANLMINRGFDSHFGFLKGGEDHQTQCLSDADGWKGPDLWRNHGPAVQGMCKTRFKDFAVGFGCTTVFAIPGDAFAVRDPSWVSSDMYDDTLMLFTADNGGVTHGGQLGNN
eukprot:gene17835-30798_t